MQRLLTGGRSLGEIPRKTGSGTKNPTIFTKEVRKIANSHLNHLRADIPSERVHLLNHILAIIVEPTAKQHPDVRKLHLNVKKLEECTNEALSGFFSENPQNSGKKRFLNEIFKVARQQERYKNGEIGIVTYPVSLSMVVLTRKIRRCYRGLRPERPENFRDSDTRTGGRPSEP
jgi:hypothetical protein